jgi:ubiquinone/menaquinone biosynthesis C-methylase UbiE
MKALIEKYANYIHEIRVKSPEAFFTLFDGGKDFNEAKAISEKTFNRMFLPFAKKYLVDLSEKVSLDIGYGSGFQVAEAGKHFGHSKGVDVHKEGSFVFDTFVDKKIGVGTSLMEGHAGDLPEPNDYCDFIYSWVTFLHFPSIEYTRLALKEIFRVLKPGGIAVIYYSRLVKSKRKETLSEYEADIELENKHETGFSAKESLTEIFKKGIGIARWKMTELVKELGFEVLEHTYSNDGGFVFGQHGIVIQKPPIVELEGLSEEEPPAKPKKLIRRKKKSIKKT